MVLNNCNTNSEINNSNNINNSADQFVKIYKTPIYIRKAINKYISTNRELINEARRKKAQNPDEKIKKGEYMREYMKEYRLKKKEKNQSKNIPKNIPNNNVSCV